MKIGIPKEISENERRVAIVPKMITPLINGGHEVLVEAAAGEGSYFSDTEYVQAGADIVKDSQLLYSGSDVIFKVQPPQIQEAAMMNSGSIYLGFLAPMANLKVVEIMHEKKITCFAIEFIPRIARSQSMDALSSMASIAGYRAVLIAGQTLGKYFPLM